MISSHSHNLTAMRRVGLGACPYLLNGNYPGAVVIVHPEMLKMQNGSQSPPLKKGDLGGFIKAYQIPPSPPFPKGGVLRSFQMKNIYQLSACNKKLSSLRTRHCSLLPAGGPRPGPPDTGKPPWPRRPLPRCCPQYPWGRPRPRRQTRR